MKNEALANYWNSAFDYLKVDPNSTTTLFYEVIHQYTESSRHYHNLAHLQHLMRLIDEQKLSEHDRALLIITAFMHDVVYNPSKRSNEEKSAAYARQELERLNLDKQDIDTISAMIMATRGHKAEDELTQLFLDMDLAILASSTDDYRAYTKAIRKEFHHLPDTIFRAGRNAFIGHMLNRERIYHTDTFYDKWEEKARWNLQHELHRELV